MSDVELQQWADELGTPLYVFDDRALQDRVAYLRSALPDRVELCYAVKANTFLVPLLAHTISCFEVCSTGEGRICLASDAPADTLVISGVNKDAAFIDELIGQHVPVRRYTIESRAQLDLLLECATKHDVTIPVLPRLTSGNQFGLDKAELKAVIRDFADNPHLDFKGIQYFSGTQKESTKRLARELRQCCKMIDALKEEFGFECGELEFGAGFPVQYFDDAPFDEAAFLEEFSQLINEMPYQGPIVLELGRSIAASCGTYLTRVADAKTNAGANYAIVDGGMNHLVYFGQSLAMRQPQCGLIGKAAQRDQEIEPWNICGSLCSVNDILAKQLELPGLHIGDVLAFRNAGAYCATEGISLFLSRTLPQVCLIDENGQAQLARGAVETYPLNGVL